MRLKAISTVPGVSVVLLLISTTPAKTQPLPVTISLGANIQAIVDTNPENTTFTVEPGVYRLQSISPKNGDSFVGRNNPVLSGAQVLTSFGRQGKLWVVAGQAQQGQRNGTCDAQHPRCMYPEDLFFDSVPLLHVGNLGDVVPGKWFFDYPNQQILFADDPTGHVVETSVTRSAFYGPASNVTISGFTIEKYAVPAQFGAVGDQLPGPNWTVTNNEVRWNHGGGVNLVDGGTATLNYLHHNGQKGIGGTGDSVLVQGNEISFNNWAGFDCSWECGGLKFALTSFLVVSGNSVHDNAGPGVWNDVDSIYTLYENNTIMNNTGGAGIQYEISYSAIIRYNNICNNSVPGPTNWLWGSQILLQNSQDVQVYGNTVETPAASFSTEAGSIGSNGIGIIQQNRGFGAYGLHLAMWNWIHNNTIVHRGVTASGEVADYNEAGLVSSGNNAFDYNSYHLIDPEWYHWNWGGSFTFAGFQKAGQELHGSADAILPPSSCSAQPN